MLGKAGSAGGESELIPMDPDVNDPPPGSSRGSSMPRLPLSASSKSSGLHETEAMKTGESKPECRNSFRPPPVWVAVGSILSYVIILFFGACRDLARKWGLERNNLAREHHRQRDFVQLYNDFESTYTANVYRPIRDCFNRPIASTPGATMDVIQRSTQDYCWTFQSSGGTSRVLNFGSYNYLGFAQSNGPCAEASKEAINKYGIAPASTQHSIGSSTLQHDLEKLVAEFVGAEDAIVFPMGYATNSTNLPSLMTKGTLILSDELNHSSLITGCKLSSAVKRVFRHNDMTDLERKLRDAVVNGQPRTKRPFKKILIIVEGVYSMEGSLCNLPAVIALKKRYKAYLWLDEAHSIGAMGPRGRGVVDYWGCDPKDVDVLMGTFTKSFGSSGGYLAGSAAFINHIRATGHSLFYGSGPSPVAMRQVQAALNIVLGRDGTGDGQRRIARLAWNTRYFRRKLRERGFTIWGHEDSPVIPLMLFFVALVGKFNREMLERFGMAVVTVAYPATPLTLGRARFCVSAAHTKAMIDQAVDAIDQLGDEMNLKYTMGHLLEPERKSY